MSNSGVTRMIIYLLVCACETLQVDEGQRCWVYPWENADMKQHTRHAHVVNDLHKHMFEATSHTKEKLSLIHNSFYKKETPTCFLSLLPPRTPRLPLSRHRSAPFSRLDTAVYPLRRFSGEGGEVFPKLAGG